ncbi:MAG TPA: hypothetical protein VK558_07455 [Patescibacteria group bacterium]|nr:hypothetical protein [Patescibacteria group bacterium]
MDQALGMGEVTDLLARLPPEVLDSLTADQRAALWQASKSGTWKRHAINIRLSLPLFGRRMFLTIVGGSDRRAPDRVRRESRFHPFRTTGNALFLIAVAVAFYLVAVLGIFALHSVIGF